LLSTRHSAFPKLTNADSFTAASGLDPESLLTAAEGYTVHFITDTRGSDDEEAPGLKQLRETVLPRFKREHRPFFLVYRLAEPKDPTPAPSKQDARAAGTVLDSIESALKADDFYDTKNIIVAAETVLSRVVKVSATSRARSLLPREKKVGTLPPGFLAIDIVALLQEDDPSFDLFEPDHGYA
jgi:hypothetical protein